MAVERLHKVMANAGIASRRECEAMIAAGRVSVNGKVVTEMGVKVDPQRDLIRVDGEPIKTRGQPKLKYIMLYKPAGYLSVFDDERGRPGLEALVKSDARLYPVGRLDAESEGLQLLTNDGELTLRLSHPRYEHTKTYLVLVDRVPSSEALAHFRRGIELEDGKTLPSEWRVLEKPPSVAPTADSSQAQGVWLKVTLREGRKRQIRRMAAAEKLVVRRLIRTAMGPLRLDQKLRPGESRPLTSDELRLLRQPASGRPVQGPRRPGTGRDARSGRQHPPYERKTTSGRRAPAGRGDVPGTERGPSSPSSVTGSQRSTSREMPAARQGSPDRRERSRSTAENSDTPARGQSPHRTQKPSRQEDRVQPNRFKRSAREQGPRSRPQPGSSTSRRSRSEPKMPRNQRPGGAPKRRKP